MILTTTIKQPYTTTKHNNKGYIFTLYLFMLLCVVGNCLLFYCGCTGNCENCCGINGLLRIANIDQDGEIDGNKILNRGFINGENKASVNVSIYRGSTEKDYDVAKKEFMDKIDTTGKTYLIAYVEVGDIARYFIHYKDANSKHDKYYYGLFEESEATKIVILRCGSKIENMSNMFYNCSSLIELDLSKFTTNKVTNMSYMFYGCSSLTNIKFSNNFNTNNVINMSYMFSYCSSLKELNLSSLNTSNVTDMRYMFWGCRSLTNIKFHDNLNTNTVTNMRGMFAYCSSLTELNLSKFNSNKVTDMGFMFNKCFKEEQTSILICKASTLKKITDKGGLRLTISENVKNINALNNPERVYTCSVKRVGNNSQITLVVEYKSQK